MLTSVTIQSLAVPQKPVEYADRIETVRNRANELGMSHLWCGITDFDQQSMRQELPGAVKAMHKEVLKNPGVVYVHCTGGMLAIPANPHSFKAQNVLEVSNDPGMHRSASVALAYQWWVDGWHLDDAYENMKSKRPQVEPYLHVIRKSTADLLYSDDSAATDRVKEIHKADTALTRDEAAKLHAILEV